MAPAPQTTRAPGAASEEKLSSCSNSKRLPVRELHLVFFRSDRDVKVRHGSVRFFKVSARTVNLNQRQAEQKEHCASNFAEPPTFFEP